MTQAARPLVGPGLDGLAPVDRHALAALWTGAARSGTDDVATLAALVLVLSALGAPAPMVCRAAGCGAQQAASAFAASSLAAAYSGREPGPTARPALLSAPPGGVRRPGPALRRLALRALRDGWLLGGHVAQVTSWAGATCSDPAVREVLTVVARAEAAQAALWRDVLDWALAQRPRLLGRLRKVDLVQRSPLLDRPAQADPVVLAAHGWPRTEEVARLWAAHRAVVVARLAQPSSASSSAAAHWA
ncbi:MAG: ferritin-like protein [Frankiales bacterium]|nr:ferritin-like protein [Frankiales bacterium]